MENIIIDQITSDYVSGWMYKKLSGQIIYLYYYGNNYKLICNFSERKDLNDNTKIGFICKIPENINIKSSDIINSNIYFFIYDKLPIRITIWAEGFIKFCLKSLDKERFDILNQLINMQEFINIFKKPENTYKNSLNDVIVESDGYLFLQYGSNLLKEQYDMPPEVVTKKAEYISLIIKKRYEYANSHNIAFLQLVFPEKTSVLSKKIYNFTKGPTPLYKKLQTHFKDSSYFLDFENVIADENCWRKSDTHLTVEGYLKILITILNVLYININFDELKESQFHTAYITADLLNNLTRSKNVNFEKFKMLDQLLLNGRILEPECIFKHNPSTEGHIGTIRKFCIKNAPVDKKLIVFGNSFFENGSHSNCLSWYFARIFKNFQFYWTPDMPEEIIEKENPDIIICQTVERYLPQMEKYIN